MKKDFRLNSNYMPNFNQMNKWDADRDEAYRQLREHNIVTDEDVQKQGRLDDKYNDKIDEVMRKEGFKYPPSHNQLILTKNKVANILDKLRDTSLKNLDTIGAKIFKTKDPNELSRAQQELRKRIYKEYKNI